MRKTITLVAPNGAKVRTVHSRRFFVVYFHEVTSKYNYKTREYDHFTSPVSVAGVVKRTDSAQTAFAELRKAPYSQVVFDVTGDGTPIQLTAEQVRYRAEDEKARTSFRRGLGEPGAGRFGY